MPLAETAFHILNRPVTLGEIGYGIAAAALLGLLAIYWNSRRHK